MLLKRPRWRAQGAREETEGFLLVQLPQSKRVDPDGWTVLFLALLLTFCGKYDGDWCPRSQRPGGPRRCGLRDPLSLGAGALGLFSAWADTAASLASHSQRLCLAHH